ncbi:MAG: enoyl-CoA hydratase [Acidimicrobiales bacterium]
MTVESGDTGVALVTLNDPERRNVLSAGMVDSIISAFDSIEADGTIGAVVVTGAGSAFCAGADLAGLSSARFSAADDQGGTPESALSSIYEGFLRVARCGLPTVAAVNGPAVGAGMNLALACDVRVVGQRGRFDCRFAELGLHPGGGHTWMLERAVGAETAAAMVLFGEALEGQQAVARGLAWTCEDDDILLEKALALAALAARAPTELSRRMKETLRMVRSIPDHPEAVAYELEAQLWSLEQPFFAERLAGFRARISNR